MSRNHAIAAAAGCLVGLATGALVTRDLPGVLFATGLLAALALLFGAGWRQANRACVRGGLTSHERYQLWRCLNGQFVAVPQRAMSTREGALP